MVQTARQSSSRVESAALSSPSWAPLLLVFLGLLGSAAPARAQSREYVAKFLREAQSDPAHAPERCPSSATRAAPSPWARWTATPGGATGS